MSDLRFFRVVRMYFLFSSVLARGMHDGQHALHGGDTVDDLVGMWQRWVISVPRFGCQYCGVCERRYWATYSCDSVIGIAELVGGTVHPSCAQLAAESLTPARVLLQAVAALSPDPQQVARQCGTAFMHAWTTCDERHCSMAELLRREDGQETLARFARGAGEQAITDCARAWARDSFRATLLERRVAKWQAQYGDQVQAQGAVCGIRARDGVAPTAKRRRDSIGVVGQNGLWQGGRMRTARTCKRIAAWDVAADDARPRSRRRLLESLPEPVVAVAYPLFRQLIREPGAPEKRVREEVAQGNLVAGKRMRVAAES